MAVKVTLAWQDVGRAFNTPPKKFTLKDEPRFKIKADGYKQPFTQLEDKRKLLRLNKPYRTAVEKLEKHLEMQSYASKVHAYTSKLLNVRQTGRLIGRLMKPDTLLMRNPLVTSRLLNSRESWLQSLQLEAVHLDSFRIETGAHTGTQLDYFSGWMFWCNQCRDHVSIYTSRLFIWSYWLKK